MDSIITSKGQVVIPAAFRKKLGFQPGNKVHFEERDGKLELSIVDIGIVDRLKGSFKDFDLLEDLAVLRKEERERDRF
jgi:AbrB family looped-hinge helix DNA binding protein